MSEISKLRVREDCDLIIETQLGGEVCLMKEMGDWERYRNLFVLSPEMLGLLREARHTINWLVQHDAQAQVAGEVTRDIDNLLAQIDGSTEERGTPSDGGGK